MRIRRLALCSQLFFGFLIGILSCTSFAQGNTQVLDVVLSQAPSTRESDAGIIVITITNKSNEPLFLPIQRTPLYGKLGRLWGYVFDVTDQSGKKAKFIGDFLDIVAPKKLEDFTWRIEPGQTLTQKVNLPIDYDLSSGGAFKVIYEQPFLIKPYMDENGKPIGRWKEIKSNILTLWVSSSLAAPASQASTSIMSPLGLPNFPDMPELSCSSEPKKMQSISQAMITASEWIGKASNHLAKLYYIRRIEIEMEDADGNVKKETKYKPIIKYDFKYNQWFGNTGNKDDDTLIGQAVYDRAPSLGDVSDKTDFFPLKEFNALSSRSTSLNSHYHCGCAADGGINPLVAAVAKTTNPYLVDVCDHFFELDAEEQAQTFVHEWSHFEDNYAERTFDYSRYDSSNARQLAIDNRDKAVKNADSVGYFAKDVATHSDE